MALSHVLELTSGPAVVPKAGFVSPITSAVYAMRGANPTGVQVVSAGDPVALPDGAQMFYGIKLPGGAKGPWLALCQLTPSTSPNSVGLWLGLLQLNTQLMRNAMHAEESDATPELLELDCLAEIYYTVPGQVDPVLSLNFDFKVGAPLYNGIEAIAPDPAGTYPPEIASAIDLASNALQAGQNAAVNDLEVAGRLKLGLDTILSIGGEEQQNVVLFVDADGYLRPLALAAGQTIRRRADGSGFEAYMPGGGGSGAPAGGFTLHPFATNADKLASSDVQPGDHAGITGEADRVEQYLGALAGDKGAGFTIAGSGSGYDGTYHLDSSINAYVCPASGCSMIGGAGNYNLTGSGPDVASTGGSGYPWECVWPFAAGYSVTRSDVASDENWLTLKNTIHLLVIANSACTVNGVECAAGALTDVGWCNAKSVSYSSNSLQYLSSLKCGPQDIEQMLYAYTSFLQYIYNGTFLLGYNFPDRARVVVGITDQ